MLDNPLLVSLLSPMVLAFFLGVIATLVRSDLKFPEELYIALTVYLLMAIGLKGGYKLSMTPFAQFWKPGLAALLIGCAVPMWCYWILRRIGKFDVSNSAAIAAHYGSVSAVTFSAALVLIEKMGAQAEGFMPTLLTILEVPAILVAIGLARVFNKSDSHQMTGDKTGEFLRELFAGKSTFLPLGCLVIGLLSGKNGWAQVSALFDTPFQGVLTVFLLEAGIVTGRRLGDFRKVGPFLVAFGIVMPILHAVIGIVIGKSVGLSLGGSTVFAALVASASYIAAPAACRVALPQANPTYYLTTALAVTFPFNIVIGLPLYHSIAKLIYGG